MGQKKTQLDRRYVSIDPRHSINPILGSAVENGCSTQAGKANPCLYYDTREAEIVLPEHDTTKEEAEKRFGLASYYGPKTHGLPTSVQTHYDPCTKQMIAKRFDMYDYFVASNIYAPGTVLNITDLTNNNSMLAVVGDFGPNTRFKDRIIDLSAGIYFRLHGNLDGLIPVSIQPIPGAFIMSVEPSPICQEPTTIQENTNASLPQGEHSFSIETTNRKDAYEILFHLAEKYPDRIYIKKRVQVIKKGEYIYLNGKKKKWVRVKQNSKVFTYHIECTFSEKEIFDKAWQYASEKKWRMKHIKFKT